MRGYDIPMSNEIILCIKSRRLLLLCTCAGHETLLNLSCQAETISGNVGTVPPTQTTKSWAPGPHNLINISLVHNPIINPT